ncbi:unnamed protein product [Arabis nemorensis]|uniref:PABC domain-containing protein n=1 Tax=Arabis nemorensis TaxID=586526 RepID=A0A565BRU5_9BRAS|nr:unnamed protein product [Arabis nemorensis]
MLGGCLYPLVEELEPLWTADVTGLLLEMDQSIILHLIESPDALKVQVKEAIKVLSDWFPEQMLLMSSTKPMRVKSAVSTYFESDCRLPQGTYWVNLAFVYATPERQRDILGECLFPLVEKHEPIFSAKVTGMLLEMDQSEILHLIFTPEALKAKVEEAVEVLWVSWIPQQLEFMSSCPTKLMSKL